MNAHSQRSRSLTWTEAMCELADEGVVGFLAYAALVISIVAAPASNMDTFVQLAGQFCPALVVWRGSP